MVGGQPNLQTCRAWDTNNYNFTRLILFYFIENGEHFLLYLSLNLYHQNVITHHSCKGNFHDQPI